MSKVTVFLLSIAVMVGYTNCGKPQHVVNGVVASSAYCESQILQVFEKTYYPFLVQKCAGCHATGPGFGFFASDNSERAIDSFLSIGESKIKMMAVNAAHNPPYTSPDNQPVINTAAAEFGPAKQIYDQCLQSGSEDGPSTFLKLNPKVMNAKTGNTWTKVNWDLIADVESGAETFEATLSVEVRINKLSASSAFSAYEFRNPTINSRVHNLKIQGFNMVVNDDPMNTITSYNNLNKVAVAGGDVNLGQGLANAYVVMSQEIRASDSVHVEFVGIGQTSDTSGGGIPTPTPIATPTPTPPDVITYTYLKSTFLKDKGCLGCHAGGTLNLNMHTGTTGAQMNAAKILQSVENQSMPKNNPGSNTAEQIMMIRKWVDAGAPL